MTTNAAGSQYLQDLGKPCVAAWREEVGEPRVHDIDAGIGQRDVFG